MDKKYGRLDECWRQTIHDGFYECLRVLKTNGTLIFKWNEYDIKVSEIIKVIGMSPLYGHKSGKLQKTHWLVFFKEKTEHKKIIRKKISRNDNKGALNMSIEDLKKYKEILEDEVLPIDDADRADCLHCNAIDVAISLINAEIERQNKTLEPCSICSPDEHLRGFIGRELRK